MNAGKPSPQFLDIPGRPTLWRTTDLPPRRIELPCLGRMSRWTMLLLLGFGTPLMPLAWVAAASAFNEAPFEAVTILLGLVFALPLFVLGTDAVLVALRAVFHRGYHAGFDAETLWHFQLSDPVALRNIKCLEVLCHNSQPVALRITTDRPIRLRFASLLNRHRSARRGAGTVRFTFALGIIARDAALLADAIGHLVKANGGVVERKESVSLLVETVLLWPG